MNRGKYKGKIFSEVLNLYILIFVICADYRMLKSCLEFEIWNGM